jgi:hypothetical protein
MQGNSTPQKTNNSIEDLVRNEENEYPVPDPNRAMINMTNDLNVMHTEFLQKEIKNEFIEIPMEKLQEKVKQYKMNSMNIRTITNKKLEKTHKQLS